MENCKSLNSIIKVSNLSKRYRLGLKEKQSNTLVGQISQAVRSPWENLKRLRQLNRFWDEDESVFWALKDLCFDVQEGEVLGIIGKNGAGKSTLLKILSQITEPTSGKIEIHGRVASLLEVGTGFHPDLSGRDNIYMNGTILGMTRREIDKKLDEIIDFSGVDKFIDTPVKFYSSGMKVRLGFSVAAHLDPEVLIIDEVLAVGDFEFQKRCIGKMEDVSRNQGRTVLFVSHQMEAIRKLCSSSIVLESGTVIYNGSTNNAINIYLGIDKDTSLCYSKSDGYIRNIKIDREALKNNRLSLEIYFVSPVEIKNPIVGFVLYNQSGAPVFGSNPRYHSEYYENKILKEGYFLSTSSNLNIHSGKYFLSFWFGDQLVDFEHLENVIGFEYVSDFLYTQKPDPLFIGSINQVFEWKVFNGMK